MTNAPVRYHAIADTLGRSSNYEAPFPLVSAGSVEDVRKLAMESLSPGSYALIDDHGRKYGYIQVGKRDE